MKGRGGGRLHNSEIRLWLVVHYTYVSLKTSTAVLYIMETILLASELKVPLRAIQNKHTHGNMEKTAVNLGKWYHKTKINMDHI